MKIAIVGPESSGKTTLAEALALHFQTVWVPEFARTYLNKLKRPYQESDLLAIAKGQLKAEANTSSKSSSLFFCDTNLLVIKVWSEVKYQRCDPWILNHINLGNYAFHLLVAPDIPWEPDPLRENPFDRDELFDIYQEELINADVPFAEIKGDHQMRLNKSIELIEGLK